MDTLSPSEILDLLQNGTLTIEGLLPWSSNYTFLTQVCGPIGGQTVEISAVYKPRRGERPLWDFAQGTLCQRERAAYLISQELNWHIIPPTVLRRAEHGTGSLQHFIDHDPDRHYFTFEGSPAYQEQLQKIALFDILANNADRKSGHVLLQERDDTHQPDRLWGIDHGICFHTDYKLRTVIWEFAGQPIPAPLLTDLKKLLAHLHNSEEAISQHLAQLLSAAEVRALQRRVQRLINNQVFPNPGPGRHYPWPPV